MIEPFLGFFATGLLDASWLVVALAFLGATQLTILAVTLYLHRCQAHRAVSLHPLVSHVFRFWLWLTTGMRTREWVAIHRKHHARCETEEDPHSPMTHGIRHVLFRGVELYQREADNERTMEDYGRGTPEDWLERNIYHPWSVLGPTLMFFLAVGAFGAIGVTFWALQMAWIPFFAAGVVNGLGHWVGYRSYETPDTSHNLVPWAVFIGGEELHNNHHAFPSSAKFALKPWELDIGWGVIRALETVRLAEVLRVAPAPAKVVADKEQVDGDTVRAVLTHRFHVMRVYVSNVIRPVLYEEARGAGASMAYVRRLGRRLLAYDWQLMDEARLQRLRQLTGEWPSFATVCYYRERLNAVWARSAGNSEARLEALRQWCREAEASGIQVLQDFAASLRRYSMAGSTA